MTPESVKRDIANYRCVGRKKRAGASAKGSKLFPDDVGKGLEVRFIALVVGPLTDTPYVDQARPLQGRQIVGHRRLRQPDAFLDAADADADLIDVTFVLRREMLRRVLQSFEDVQAGAVGEGFEDVE